MSDTTIIQAAQSKTLLEAAQAYARLGLSVLPLRGKRPALESWTVHRQQAATLAQIHQWHKAGLLQNVGLVCGAVSKNLVVLDLDGAAGYPAFAATFPRLVDTYTVASGGGIGRHVYWQVDTLPPAVKAMSTPLGNLELCAEGRQVVAPPSIHPTTGQPYRVDKALPILHLPDLIPLVDWIESFKPKQATPTWQPPVLGGEKGDLNPQIIAAVAHTLTGRGYKVYGDWLHGPCVYPHHHKNGDRNPSFGFNTRTGYGYCHVCGTMLLKDLCTVLGIDPDLLGGLFEKTETVSRKPIHLAAAPSTEQPSVQAPPAGDVPPEMPSGELHLETLDLPRWLKEYVDWAGATGNQTPLSFHLFAGLWLTAAAIGRRLHAEAPWGQSLYPNLYLLVVAVSTFYRKSTAYRLAEQVALQVFPHLLLPTPGSPERLLNSLAGTLPPNFKSLSVQQQTRLQQAQPFAAQRALRIDEIAGLLGALNKREYMVAMKDHLFEIYDCPSVLTRDTQTGLTIIERPSLSILGLTTPAALSHAVGFRDWMDGLFPRFQLISPETNYVERPPLTRRQPIPPFVLSGLQTLFTRLPVPPDPTIETPLDAALPLEWEVGVDCWEECMRYGETLRLRCNPRQTEGMEERLRPVYGRLHVQAFKIAMLLAALRWIETPASSPVPTITRADWLTAETLAEYLRASVHQLIDLLDRSGEVNREQQLQEKILRLCAAAGTTGCTNRDLSRTFHRLADETRDAARELVRAGLLYEQQQGKSERFFLVQV